MEVESGGHCELNTLLDINKSKLDLHCSIPRDSLSAAGFFEAPMRW